MPAARKNNALRIAVPLIIVAIGVFVIPLSFLNMKSPGGTNQTSQNTTPNTSVPPEANLEAETGDSEEAANDSDEQADAAAPPPSTDASNEGAIAADPGAESGDEEVTDGAPVVYRVRPQESRDPTSIGSLDPASDQMMEVRFSPWGAGIRSIQLAEHYHSIEQAEHYHIQEERGSLTPMAARQVLINGQAIELYSVAEDLSVDPPVYVPAWREVSPGHFQAEIEDGSGRLVARIHRVYSLAPESYDLSVRQSVENLTDDSMEIEWRQYGPAELLPDDSGYRLQARRLRVAYVEQTQFDPMQQAVVVDHELEPRTKIIDQWRKALNEGSLPQVWPNAKRFERADHLAWIAQSNRYFVCAVHPQVDPSQQQVDKKLHLAERVFASVRPGYDKNNKFSKDESTLMAELWSDPMTLEPGARTTQLHFGIYAGPMDREVLRGSRSYTDPAVATYESLALDDVIIYNLGGMCMWCTFQPLAHGLLWLLLQFDAILGDWAIAIILLVFCVRGALHPITRRSQIGIQRFSKQMQAISPKIKKLQEKYKGDQKRMQAEMARLYKEEGVNFANALGCLPMFLQTPIWIALYAMLYFAIELRHEPAFYGVFQQIGGWQFLADLAVPDRFIMLPGAYEIPLLSGLWGSLQSINILPIVLGIVFFVHQKYMTPPTSATMTPEQQQQQKIMKVMMVVMFPFMLYNAPSGLTVYFITNSTLGILESRWIRAHIDKSDLEPKKPTPPPGGRKKVQNVAKPKKELPKRKFKERG